MTDPEDSKVVDPADVLTFQIDAHVSRADLRRAMLKAAREAYGKIGFRVYIQGEAQ